MIHLNNALDILRNALDSTQCKAWASLRKLKDDITDKDIIGLYSTLCVAKDDPLLYKETMKNIHGAKFNEHEQSIPIFDIFHKLVYHDVMPLFNKQGTTWDELGIYHYGLGRNLLGVAMLLLDEVIRKDQAKNIIKELFEPICIGVCLEDFILRSPLFADEDDSTIHTIIDQVLRDNPKIVSEFKAGKDKVIGSLVGQIMKQQKADPMLVNELLRAKIREL